jgi:hypothetical protein
MTEFLLHFTQQHDIYYETLIEKDLVCVTANSGPLEVFQNLVAARLNASIKN